MDKKIKVLIAEDIEPIRKRYCEIINNEPDLEVVADVSNMRDAITKTKELQPDVILMDIEMDSKDAGLIATKEILAKYPHKKIIILTVYEEDEFVFSAFQLGVCDYMLKNSTYQEIINGIKAAYLGQSPIRPEIAGKIRNEFKRIKSYENSFLYMLNILSSLTSSELEILYLIAKGYTRKEICAERHVEMSTVKTQIHNILKKFKKNTIKELINTIDDLSLLEMVINNRTNR
ncbi:MAG: response regulator transcription factor [Clostridiales bacterium]|nr:response regulator transcription factor [Clostridiales bacterium]